MSVPAESLAHTPPIDDEEARYRDAQRRARWRRRALPALGIVGLIALWWAVVVIFQVKPFIAPSPWAVVQTLYLKRDVLLSNLVPTAGEALGGFLLGNFVAIAVATLFVHYRRL